ncbi:hypothetical protein IPV08_08265 [Methylobacterium sp. SD274]|jgi:hypothetical protein|uniref:Uncharacterized protein n=1 Tax=Methylobacterium gossipiicola TaxID=582675 RepID=A0A1I2V046_9HYPH|nr:MULTISPECIES: hypothetical protein [Methylobacterium]MBO1019957.1 hypothetical protein [Methylobacterium sp. SD274]SFG82553.1 hypothetical protein SAMN05192565_112114 [Methylobacterium gossipiicola]
MTTIWLKAAYTREDRDPKTGDFLPGAVPPGIYCADEASFEAFKEGVRAKGKVLSPGLDGPGYEGLSVRIATPEQVALFTVSAVDDPGRRPQRPPQVAGNRQAKRAAEAKARRRA